MIAKPEDGYNIDRIANYKVNQSVAVQTPSAAQVWVEKLTRIQPQSEKISNRSPKGMSLPSWHLATKPVYCN